MKESKVALRGSVTPKPLNRFSKKTSSKLHPRKVGNFYDFWTNRVTFGYTQYHKQTGT